MSTRSRRTDRLLCGNDTPPRLTSSTYAECPRCGAMAIGYLSDIGEVFSVCCPKWHCGLDPSSEISIWDPSRKRVVDTVLPLHLQQATDIAVIGNVPVEIWQGDLLVARFDPKQGIHYCAGRCAVEEDS